MQLVTAITAWSCGCERGWFNYLVPWQTDGVAIVRMPDAYYRFELNRFLTPAEDDARWFDDQMRSKDSINRVRWQSTVERDCSQVAEYIQGNVSDLDERGRLVKMYREFRESMRPQRLNEPYSERTSPVRRDETAPALPDVDSFGDVLKIIPAEFRLYAVGSSKYYAGDIEGAATLWRELLLLPPDQRKYRSTWAAFMLGKVLIKTNPQEAVAQFNRLHELFREGFEDPLDLQTECITWEIEAQFYAGDPVGAFHRYADLYEHGDRVQRNIAFVELRQKSRDCVRSSEMSAKAAADPLARNLIAASLVPYSRYHQHYPVDDLANWIFAIEAAKLNDLIESADKLAWAAYSRGEFELARRCIALCDREQPYAMWVESKLDLRDGNVDEAIQTLQRLQERFPETDDWRTDCGEWTQPCRNVSSELGALLLARREYKNAMNAFLKGGNWYEAAYIAERVLTTAELETMLTSAQLLAGENDRWRDDIPNTNEDAVEYLLARRFVREGNWEKALKYMPEEYQLELNDLIFLLTVEPSAISVSKAQTDRFMLNPFDTRDTRFPRGTLDPDIADRKEAAAELVRKWGMELMGTELWPDETFYQGSTEPRDITSMRGLAPSDDLRAIAAKNDWWVYDEWYRLPVNVRAAISSSTDERKRLKKSVVVPEKRFHYHYKAANLIWQSAALLPDNDESLMRVLWTGGSYLKARDPAAANKFYRALVVRNRDMPYAQEADRLRWFPKDPP